MYGAECIEGLPENVHYLCNSSVVIENKLFYGVPMFMEDVLKGNYDSMSDNIPLETDVLVTHQPPYGILDGGEYHGEPCHYGEELLQQKVMEVKPRAHLFGHVHNMFDTIVQNDIIFSNAALLDDHYNLCVGLRTIEL